MKVKGRCGMNHVILSLHQQCTTADRFYKYLEQNSFQSGITGCMGTYNLEETRFHKVVGGLVVTLMYSDCGVACYTLLVIIFKLCCVHL